MIFSDFASQGALSFSINMVGSEKMDLHMKVCIYRVYSVISMSCKHKHMRKNGAPLDNFGVLYRLSHMELHGHSIFF